MASSTSIETSGSISNTFIPFQPADRNYLGKIVEWIRGPEDRPLVLKVFVYALTFILSGLLFATVVGIPLVLAGFKENIKQQEEMNTLPVIRELETQLEEMKEEHAVQIREKVSEIAVLNSQVTQVNSKLSTKADEVEQEKIRAIRLQTQNNRLVQENKQLDDKLKKTEEKLKKTRERLQEDRAKYEQEVPAFGTMVIKDETKEEATSPSNEKPELLKQRIEEQEHLIQKMTKQLEVVQTLFQGINALSQQNPRLLKAAEQMSKGDRDPFSIKVTPELQKVLQAIVVMNRLATPPLLLTNPKPKEERVIEEI